MKRFKNPAVSLILFGSFQEGIWVGVASLGNLRESIPVFLLLYFSAFLVFLLAVRYCNESTADAEQKPVLLLLVVGFALLFRATVLFSEPSLSEDIYRYLWDGKLINEGVNPYRHVPGSQELAYLRDTQYEKINHKDIGTPYGPLTLMIFAISQRVVDSVYFLKIPFVVFDCLTMILILRMLAFSGAPGLNLIVYAWNPLVLVEVAGSGHSDSLGILLLLATIYLVQRGRYWTASGGYALAFLAKYFSLLFLPAILKHFRRGEWLLFSLVLLAGFWPFATYLESHLLNMMEVGSTWRFNDSIFSLLLFLTGSLYFSKMLIVVAMLVVAVMVWRSRWSPVKSAMIMIGSALLLATTVQPWYLLWMLPFLCFAPNRAWLLLTGLIMLSYLILVRYEAEGIWSESLWVKLAIYIPFFTLLISDRWRNLRAGHTD